MNVSDFLAMGGYGFYVWSSYLITAVVIAIEVFSVRARLGAAKRNVNDRDTP